jgi:serine phosphatase RsbU (regulator of sigma subunit)
VARGRALGAITLLTGESGRKLGPDDLTLARDLARHAALAVDNARLYRQRAEIASTLQRSLLPPSLPDIPGIELAARYRAAGEGVDVGGDFYDAFQIGEDDWIIAVGDVCGKGPAAAALAGLARHTLHASALRERRPSRILAILNEAILRQSEETTFCTLVCGRLERRNHAVGLTFACGGHPLPLVVAANGNIQTVGCYGTLVGVFADAEFADEALELEPGETLVLYTDGLIEAYGGPVEAGQGRLAEVIRACAGAPAEEMAGRIDRLIPGGQTDRDDITFLVLRVAG